MDIKHKIVDPNVTTFYYVHEWKLLSGMFLLFYSKYYF